MGYGVVERQNGKLFLLRYGVLKLSGYDNPYVKLEKIYSRVSELIKEYRPVEMAIEAPFFGQNVQSMLKLGRAQGVAIAAALAQTVPVVEYAPKKIKQSVTGNGNASKEQVAAMLPHFLDMQKGQAEFSDETDAIAVAVCHLNHKTLPGKKASNWSAFIKENPERLK